MNGLVKFSLSPFTGMTREQPVFSEVYSIQKLCMSRHSWSMCLSLPTAPFDSANTHSSGKVDASGPCGPVQSAADETSRNVSLMSGLISDALFLNLTVDKSRIRSSACLPASIKNGALCRVYCRMAARQWLLADRSL